MKSPIVLLIAMFAVFTLPCLAPAQPTSMPATPTSEPALPTMEVPSTPRVIQPAAFLALAEKAKKAGPVYCKGFVGESGEQATNLPAEMRMVPFEMWLELPSAKSVFRGVETVTRVTDGVNVYTLIERPNQEPEGRARKLAGLYPSLGPMALMYDAIRGYTDIASAVAFKSIDAPAGVPAAYKDLKWFRLGPGLPQGHFILKDAKEVSLGLDARTGLPRMLVGSMTVREKPVTETVTYETIDVLKARSGELLLPPSAAGAKWQDADTRQQSTAPKDLIQIPVQSQPAGTQPAKQE
jgi:hypothetical protein